ncbi:MULTISPECIES: hypothetical protein [Parachlamydia]|jgi:hypothetical protein|nr:hypothetical protein [Parachlamydia acanthamoebae]
MNITALYSEDLYQSLRNLPETILDHTLSFLPPNDRLHQPGNPLHFELEMRKAYLAATDMQKAYQTNDNDNERVLVQVRTIVQNAFTLLKKYKVFMNPSDSLPEASIIWAQFVQKFALRFEVTIRREVRLEIAKAVRDAIFEHAWPELNTLLWYTLVPLREPVKANLKIKSDTLKIKPYQKFDALTISKPYIKTLWRVIDPKKELEILKSIITKRKSFFERNISLMAFKNSGFEKKSSYQQAITCDCCRKISKINFEIVFPKLLHYPAQTQSRDIHAEILPKSVPPAELPEALEDFLIQTVGMKLSEQRLKKPCRASPGDSSSFVSFLDKSLKTRMTHIVVQIQKGEKIPAGACDIPTILKMLENAQTLFKNKKPDEISLKSEISPSPAHTCIHLKFKLPDYTWQRVYRDNASWLNHHYRLARIVSLAIRLVDLGYHVKME